MDAKKKAEIKAKYLYGVPADVLVVAVLNMFKEMDRELDTAIWGLENKERLN